jgi:hypothetical protein
MDLAVKLDFQIHASAVFIPLVCVTGREKRERLICDKEKFLILLAGSYILRQITYSCVRN